jgi:hypothetical protein
MMKTSLKLPLLTMLAAFLAAAACAEDELPKTQMTERGKLLLSEDFTKPLEPFTGKPVGFASGFSGWRYGGSLRGGHWEVMNGVFTGSENPEGRHPATASYGIQFKDAIIQIDMRLDDAPANGRANRYAQLKATDTKDYVCVLTLGQGGLTGRPYDDAQINPATKQRMEGWRALAAATVNLGEWHTVVLEIKGEECVGSFDGKSITFGDPLIGADKHSIMLIAGTESSFRNLRLWEALPNPDWPKNKEAILSASQPPAK